MNYYYYLVYISAYKELKVERLSLYNFKSDFYCAMLIPSNSQKFSRIFLKYVHTYLVIYLFFLQFLIKSPYSIINCVSNTVAQNSIVFWAKSCKWIATERKLSMGWYPLENNPDLRSTS